MKAIGSLIIIFMSSLFLVFMMIAFLILLLCGIAFTVNFIASYIDLWQTILIVLGLSVIMTIFGFKKAIEKWG